MPESSCSRTPFQSERVHGPLNTAETYTAAALSQFSINVGEIELDNISLRHIRNHRTVW